MRGLLVVLLMCFTACGETQPQEEPCEDLQRTVNPSAIAGPPEARLVAEPMSLTFEHGLDQTRTLRLTNRGGACLRITDIALIEDTQGAEFSYGDWVTAANLEFDEFLDLEITHTADDDEEDSGFVVVASNTPSVNGVVEIPIRAVLP